MDIGRYLPFPIDLSPERLRGGTSEGQQALYQFEAESPLMFRQIDMFNILVSESRLRHRELHNKVNIIREFDTVDLVVVIKQVKSSRKDGISRHYCLKQRDHTES